MSRRIVIFLLAASAALIATEASADRECFENSCHTPEVIEPPAPPAQPPAAAENSRASSERAVVHEIVAPPAGHPEPASRPVAVRHAEKVDTPSQAPAPKAPRPVSRETRPLHETSPRREPVPESASYVRPVRTAAAERAPAVRERVARGGALIVNVPAASYGMEGVAAVQPLAIYGDTHAPRMYVLAPNAKIITIDSGD